MATHYYRRTWLKVFIKINYAYSVNAMPKFLHIYPHETFTIDDVIIDAF